MKPTAEQDKILGDRKCRFRTSIVKGNGPTKWRCEIVDADTQVVQFHEDADTEQEAFDKCIAALPDRAKVYSSEDAKIIADKDAEIARLKAELGKSTKKVPATV